MWWLTSRLLTFFCCFAEAVCFPLGYGSTDCCGRYQSTIGPLTLARYFNSVHLQSCRRGLAVRLTVARLALKLACSGVDKTVVHPLSDSTHFIMLISVLPSQPKHLIILIVWHIFSEKVEKVCEIFGLLHIFKHTQIIFDACWWGSSTSASEGGAVSLFL